MPRGVVVAHRETTFKEIAGLFHLHGVSAVPVVDERHRPVGLVSEADLVRKESASWTRTTQSPAGSTRAGATSRRPSSPKV
ncbi:CBS domain-containing protein [Kitasatospora sp. NPDC056531]|uniref:CBS domain-containing protein n=1 Tax=Kitasatospora sp. NPDC056531 TaxID=3345856 RepID=UPI00367871BA